MATGLELLGHHADAHCLSSYSTIAAVLSQGLLAGFLACVDQEFKAFSSQVDLKLLLRFLTWPGACLQ